MKCDLSLVVESMIPIHRAGVRFPEIAFFQSQPLLLFAAISLYFGL